MTEEMEKQENPELEETGSEDGNIPIEDAADETAGEEADTEEAAGAETSETSEESEEEEPAESEEPAEEESEDGGKKDGVKGFFKKKKDKKDEQIEELTDKLKRQIAEFDNFRKRSEREKSQMFDMGAKTVIEKLLPVADNFERGLAAVPEDQLEDAFVSGMDKIYKQFMTELENLGVKPIECVGKEFDPDFHNAVMQVESEEYESGVVAQELQKGYTYRDSVVRHSMVAVVQ